MISKSLGYICSSYVSILGPDSVMLGVEEIQKRETEKIMLPGKKESRVGWVPWAARPWRGLCKVARPQWDGRGTGGGVVIYTSRKLLLGIWVPGPQGSRSTSVSWK